MMLGTGSGEIDDDFNVIGLLDERLFELLRRNTARDQPAQPFLVSLLECGDGILIVRKIGVDGAEYQIVVEHHGAIDLADVNVEIVSRRRDADQTNDAARSSAA